MKNSGLIISIWGTILIFSSTKCSVESIDRQVSSPISCSSSIECFSIVDSLFQNINSSVTKWSTLPKADSLINFHDYSNLTSNATILVKDFVEVPEAVDYLIRMGSDDGIRVFINGSEIYRRIIGRSVKPDSDWVPLPLKAGLNEIVFQVNQRDGGWGLYYKIEEKVISEDLLKEHIASIYRDLPDVCIIEELNSEFALNIDPRVMLDRFHKVHFQWVDPIQQKVIWSESYSSTQLPSTIGYPEGHNSPLVLEYFVTNQSDTVYIEQIPVFELQFIDRNISELASHSELGEKWKEGLSSTYEQELGIDSNRTFSTRFKAEYLWDVLKELNYIKYAISGARTVLFNGELAKKYTPHKPAKEHILGVHVEFSDSVSQYFDSYAGKSHALMTEWTSYAQYYQTELFFPFITEQEPALSTENTITRFAESVPDSFMVVGWSKSTATILNTLQHTSYPITELGIISPWVINKSTENFLLLHNIFKNNPQIHLSMYRGEEDVDVPYYIVNDFLKQANSNGLSTSLTIVPNSSHWNYWNEPLTFNLSAINDF